MDQPVQVERRRRDRRMSDVRPPAGAPAARQPAVAGGDWRVALATAGVALVALAFAGDRLLDSRLVLPLLGFGATFGAVTWSLTLWALGRRGPIAHLRRPKLVRAVQRGIARGEFELLYQPQVGIESGDPFAVEALLRWRRRDELRLPAEFLPEVEASEAIDPLTDHVLEMALAQAGRWHRSGRPIRMSVNLSAANLRDASLSDRIADLLRTHDVPPEMLTVEVTETAVLDKPEQARAVLDAIAELGVAVSVDDFGTGYSSLLWLRLFPVAEVKIDRSFVADLTGDGHAYVSGVIRLAHDLGLSVVAEGIEDDATLQALDGLGCDIGQGFLFSRPVAAAALEEWFEDHHDGRWAPKRRELYLDADYGSLDAARALVAETARELGFDDEAIWDLKVAATEAVANAIDHGPRREDGRVHVRVTHEDGELRMDISGGRAAASPRTPQSEVHRGRGFAIMTSLMDEVGLRRSDDDMLIRLAKRSVG